MSTPKSVLALVVSMGFAVGQVASPERPFNRDALIRALSNPELASVAELREAIRRRGIDFDLTNDQLGAILRAGIQGKRDPAEMAALVVTCLRACQECRGQSLTPMTLEEIQTLLKWGFTQDAVLREAKVRGTKDWDISEGTANVLRASGANEELVALLVPDDKVPTIPLIGYNALELKHAEDYDPSAPEGWLKVTIELPAKSTSEFVFKHNSLFVRAVNGGEPTNLGAYFNKPAPRNTSIEHLDFTSSLEGAGVRDSDEKRSGGLRGIVKGKPKDEKAKDAPVLEVAYLVGDADGRQAFQIRLANKQSSPQQYSFTVRWRVLTAPGVPAAAPTKPARPAKK